MLAVLQQKGGTKRTVTQSKILNDIIKLLTYMSEECEVEQFPESEKKTNLDVLLFPRLVFHE